MYTILFVCSGNTCRSKMAEAICRKTLKKKEKEGDIKVFSAGTAASKGAPVSSYAVEAAKEKQLEINGSQSSQPVTEGLIREADLILTMTLNQKKQILSMVPEANNWTYTLKEYAQDITESDEFCMTLLEAAAKLEEKEREFYGKHGKRIEELREEYEKLQERIKLIEDEMYELEREYAEATRSEREKIKELEESVGALDIEDPFGKPLEAYKNCAVELEKHIKKTIKRFFKEING